MSAVENHVWNHILVGPLGCGKTTLLQRIMATLPRVDFQGYFVQADPTGTGGRRLVLVGGAFREYSSRRLTREIGTTGWRVFDPTSLLEEGIPRLRTALAEADAVVVDEIGDPELRTARLREVLYQALDAPIPLLAVLHDGLPLLEDLAGRPDVRIHRVDVENRTRLAEEIADYLMPLVRARWSAGHGSAGPGTDPGP